MNQETSVPVPNPKANGPDSLTGLWYNSPSRVRYVPVLVCVKFRMSFLCVARRAMTESETTNEASEEKTPKPRAKKAAAKPEVASAKGYAIIETGGKQYRVSVGDRISVEHMASEEKAEITIDRVLLLGGDGDTKVGTPVVKGATVTATVDDHFRGEKIYVFKYKPKKRYRRKIGHRQALTHLTITGINA
jgi:large subunit ribosomal protein L21